MKNNTCTGRNGLYITSSTLLEQLCVIQRKADSRNDALIWLIHSFKAEFNTKKYEKIVLYYQMSQNDYILVLVK